MKRDILDRLERMCTEYLTRPLPHEARCQYLLDIDQLQHVYRDVPMAAHYARLLAERDVREVTDE